MKKQIIMRTLIGAPIGIIISYLITIMISLMVGDGSFYPVVPELAQQCGSEINAVVLQTICSMLYGGIWAGASVVWLVEDWGITRQTFVHLLIGFLVTLPVSYLLYWMPHSVEGVVQYLIIFVIIYVSIWLSQYLSMKKKIQRMNQKLMNESDIRE